MHPRRLFTQLLIPSGAELLVGTLVTSAILILSNITSLTALLGTPDSHYTFKGLVGSYTHAAFDQFGQSATLARLTNFLLWAGAGALVYLAVWLVFDSYTMIRNDVVIGTTYTSTYRNTRMRYWAELTVRSVVRVCAVLLILLVTAVAVQIWYPLSILMFGAWVNDFTVGIHWAYMLEAFVGWIIVLHLGTIFMRLSLLRTRVFGSTAEYE
jgi:hypothetical protein